VSETLKVEFTVGDFLLDLFNKSIDFLMGCGQDGLDLLSGLLVVLSDDFNNFITGSLDNDLDGFEFGLDSFPVSIWLVGNQWLGSEESENVLDVFFDLVLCSLNLGLDFLNDFWEVGKDGIKLSTGILDNILEELSVVTSAFKVEFTVGDLFLDLFDESVDFLLGGVENGLDLFADS